MCVRDPGGRLVAAVALRQRRQRGLAALSPVAADIADFSDVLLDEAVPDAAEHLAAALLELPGWDLLELPETPPAALAWRLLGAWPGRSICLPASVCLELPVRTPESLLADMPAKQRRNLRRNERLGLQEVAVPAEPAAVRVAVGELLDLHLREWAGRGGNPLHGTDAFRRHLTASVALLVPAGRAALTRHLLAGSVVAVSLTLLTRDLVGGYLYGADPALRKQADISALLIRSALGVACDRGARRLSLLRGEEDGKLRWAPQARRNQRLLLLRPGIGRGDAAAVAGLLLHGGRGRLRGNRAATRIAAWLRS